jgi:tetratricopeptide (TPR) repeat protein
VEDLIGEAERLLRTLLALDPKHAKAHTLLAAVLQQRGRHPESLLELEAAIANDPESAEPYWRLTRSKKMGVEDHLLVERMTEMALSGSRSAGDRVLLHNALGKALDDLAQYEKVLTHFDEAHRVARSISGKPFDRQAHSALIESIITFFDGDSLVMGRKGVDSDLPVFVVGMPRSGTTLTEQILSSHPLMAGAGETPFWPDLARQVFEPACRSFKGTRGVRLCGLYLRALAQIGGSCVRVVDKNPFNAINVGLLNALFPNARFIYCRRHPVDNCLSIYMANFRFPPSYAHDREDLVFAYRESERLAAHWKNVIPQDRLFEIRYEDLVLNRDAITRRLIEFCGLEWEEACLFPERNDRLVLTASQWQARQPVYQTSVDRWKNYEPWLGAFAGLL